MHLNGLQQKRSRSTKKDEDEIFGMTASRIADLTERNRQLLEAIDHNGKTLLERFANGMPLSTIGDAMHDLYEDS